MGEVSFRCDPRIIEGETVSNELALWKEKLKAFFASQNFDMDIIGSDISEVTGGEPEGFSHEMVCEIIDRFDPGKIGGKP